MENNPSDFESVLLALLGPLRVDVDKRYCSCSTTVMSEVTAILGVKMYSILTAIVSCFCFCCIFFFFSTSKVEIYRSFLGFLLASKWKTIRRIFGPTKENQIWRIKTNEELDKLIKLKNIVNHIKAQRLSWFGHVQRMPDTRTVKKIFKWNPLTKRSQGRPKYR